MATHSSILAWKIPWTEEPGRLPFHGVTKSQICLSDYTFLFLPFSFYSIVRHFTGQALAIVK